MVARMQKGSFIRVDRTTAEAWAPSTPLEFSALPFRAPLWKEGLLQYLTLLCLEFRGARSYNIASDADVRRLLSRRRDPLWLLKFWSPKPLWYVQLSSGFESLSWHRLTRIPISKSCLSLRLSRQIFIGTTCGSSSREELRERESGELRAELLINLLMSDAIPITIRYSLKLDVKAIIQHKRDLDPLLPLKNVRCILNFLLYFPIH